MTLPPEIPNADIMSAETARLLLVPVLALVLLIARWVRKLDRMEYARDIAAEGRGE